MHSRAPFRPTRRTPIPAPGKPTPRWRETTLDLSAIITDRRFQPRDCPLDETTVSRYAHAMRRGEIFPPIQVASIKRKLHVIDGFHRLEATRQLGSTEIRASVAPMAEATAIAIAIEANARHGLPLSRKDKRRCFQLYHAAGLHLNPDGSGKSLRGIRRDLANIAWPNTVSRWLREEGIEPEPDDDGPNVSWADGDDGGDGDDAPDSAEVEQVGILSDQLDEIMARYEALEEPRSRYLVRERLTATLNRMRQENDPYAPAGLDI